MPGKGRGAILPIARGEQVGIFIEYFASRQEFEEWLAAVGAQVKVQNVSTSTPGQASLEATTYTVTYEAAARVSRKLSRRG